MTFPLPTIKLTFSGLLLLMVDHGRDHCDVGIPLEVPDNHEPRIDITLTTGIGAPVLVRRLTKGDLLCGNGEASEFSLVLKDSSHAGKITLFEQGEFDRKADSGHPNDFRWVVDIDRELHKKEVGLRHGKFLSFLRINTGTFFTGEKSEDELQTTVGGHDEPVMGKVAVAVGARIDLDQALNSVVLKKTRGKNGGKDEEVVEDVLFDFIPLPGVTYGINVSQNRSSGMHEHDADFYYNAVGSKLSPGERKYFKSVGHTHPPERFERFDGARISPHAICFIGGLSTTQRP